MFSSRHEFEMDRKIECKAKETQNDQVYQADADGGRYDSRTKGAEVELREADCGTQSLRDALEIFAWDGGVLEDHARPHLAKFGGNLGFECGELGEDVVVVGGLISSFDVDDLAGSQWVVGGICLIDSLLEHGGCIGHDNDGSVGFPVEYGLPHKQRIVIEGRRIHCLETEMRIRR